MEAIKAVIAQRSRRRSRCVWRFDGISETRTIRGWSSVQVAISTRRHKREKKRLREDQSIERPQSYKTGRSLGLVWWHTTDCVWSKLITGGCAAGPDPLWRTYWSSPIKRKVWRSACHTAPRWSPLKIAVVPFVLIEYGAEGTERASSWCSVIRRLTLPLTQRDDAPWCSGTTSRRGPAVRGSCCGHFLSQCGDKTGVGYWFKLQTLSWFIKPCLKSIVLSHPKLGELMSSLLFNYADQQSSWAFQQDHMYICPLWQQFGLLSDPTGSRVRRIRVGIMSPQKSWVISL